MAFSGLSYVCHQMGGNTWQGLSHVCYESVTYTHGCSSRIHWPWTSGPGHVWLLSRLALRIHSQHLASCLTSLCPVDGEVSVTKGRGVGSCPPGAQLGRPLRRKPEWPPGHLAPHCLLPPVNQQAKRSL